MRRVVEAVLPARMGHPFRWLVGSSWIGNLGDGIAEGYRWTWATAPSAR